MEKLICNDCDKMLEEGDEYMQYSVGKEVYLKCKKCHKKDPILRNFRKCEVYARVVGYIRPVDQWNKGKQAEYKDRVVFDAK